MAETYWEQLKEINSILEHCNYFTLQMQKIQYSLSYFVKDYKLLKTTIEDDIPESNKYKDIMLDCLSNRLGPLLNEPAFITVEFLDPRLQIFMNAEDKKTARETLKATFLRIGPQQKDDTKKKNEEIKKDKNLRKDEHFYETLQEELC